MAAAVDAVAAGVEAKLLLNEKPVPEAGAADEDELLTVEVAAVAAEGSEKEKDGAVDDGAAEADKDDDDDEEEEEEALRAEPREKPPEPNKAPVAAGAAVVEVEPSVPKEKLGTEAVDEAGAEPNEKAGAEVDGAAAEDRVDVEPNRPSEREGVVAVAAAGAAPPKEKEGATPAAAEVAAGAPNEKAAPVEAIGAAAVPNEKGALAAAENEAGAREANEKPPVEAGGAAASEAGGAAAPNENPPAGVAAPKAGAGAVVAVAAAGWVPKENVEGAAAVAAAAVPKLKAAPVEAAGAPKLNPPAAGAVFPEPKAALVPAPNPPLPNEKPDMSAAVWGLSGVARGGSVTSRKREDRRGSCNSGAPGRDGHDLRDGASSTVQYQRPVLRLVCGEHVGRVGKRRSQNKRIISLSRHHSWCCPLCCCPQRCCPRRGSSPFAHGSQYATTDRARGQTRDKVVTAISSPDTCTHPVSPLGGMLRAPTAPLFHHLSTCRLVSLHVQVHQPPSRHSCGRAEYVH